MAYQIYRNVTVTGIRSEKVTPNLRPSDIVGDTHAQASYSVRMADFSNHENGNISSIGDVARKGEVVSIAINDHGQVIALVNHTTREHAKMYSSLTANIKDLIPFLLYTAPIAAFGCWLVYRSIPFFLAGREAGFIPAGFGAGALVLAGVITKGYIKESVESGNALRKLLAGR